MEGDHGSGGRRAREHAIRSDHELSHSPSPSFVRSSLPEGAFHAHPRGQFHLVGEPWRCRSHPSPTARVILASLGFRCARHNALTQDDTNLLYLVLCFDQDDTNLLSHVLYFAKDDTNLLSLVLCFAQDDRGLQGKCLNGKTRTCMANV